MVAPGLLLLGVAQVPVTAIAVRPATLNFSVRADPSVAVRVNKVLAEVAKPTRSKMLVADDAATVLAKRCGGFAAPAIVAVEADTAGTTKIVVHQPCLAFRPYRDFMVRPGYTIQELAMASGLRPSSTETARVQKPGAANWERANPKQLSLGDKVRFTNVPVWTQVEVDAQKVPDRARLVELIAKELDCGKELVEDCVRKRGIDVVDNNKAASNRPVGIRARPAMRRSANTDFAPPASLAANVGALGFVATQPGSLPAPPLPPAPATPGQLTDAVRASAPIAADQWPYDRARVAAILAGEQEHARQVTVGVADSGLGKADGSPLPAWIFVKNGREEAQPNSNDDDGNSFVDDITGAGVARGDDDIGNGDLGVCPPAEAVTALTGETRATADHGAIVSSIATGLNIHGQHPLSVGLPRLVFFRLLSDLCSTPARLQVTEADILTAMDYVFERAPLLVLSYTISGQLTPGFVPAAKNHLDNLDKLLIIPAGNDGPGDLDQDPRCPACLALPANGVASTRTLVVGTGERTLKIASFSNWGRSLVRLYAPGEPSIALDMMGRAASTYTPATSWSAPYAGLAAVIVQSLGPPYMPMRDIRERLIGSSWPLIDPDGKAEPGNSGLLNLTAAVAVRQTAVEVVERNAAGTFERRTYVGKLDERLADLCPEGGLGPAHAIRFGAFNGDRREARARSQTYDVAAQRFPVRATLCTLPAKLHFTDIIAGRLTFDRTAVTQIVLPWN